MGLLVGLVLVFMSGAMVGTAMVPIRFMRKYQFENYWSVYNLFATIPIPWCLAFATVPNLLGVYSQLPASTLIMPPLFGLCWGIASTLGGMCISRIGLSLTYALISGIGVSGALIPLLYFSPQTFLTKAGAFLLLGVAIMIIGLVIVARAGREKERREKAETAARQGQGTPKSFIQGSFAVGLAMAMLAGNFLHRTEFQPRLRTRYHGSGGGSGCLQVECHICRLDPHHARRHIPDSGLCAGSMCPNQLVEPLPNVGAYGLSVVRVDGHPVYGVCGMLRVGRCETGAAGYVRGLGAHADFADHRGQRFRFLFGEWKVAGTHAVKIMFAGLAVLGCLRHHGLQQLPASSSLMTISLTGGLDGVNQLVHNLPNARPHGLDDARAEGFIDDAANSGMVGRVRDAHELREVLTQRLDLLPRFPGQPIHQGLIRLEEMRASRNADETSS